MTLALDRSGGRALAWLAAFIAVGAFASFGVACAAPFAAFAAVAALANPRGAALTLTASAWLVNQVVGFAFLHYPTDPATLGWGVALLAVALLACETARLVAPRAGAVAAFVASFIAYEGALYLATVASGGDTAHYCLESVTRIFAVNAAAFILLLAAGKIASAIAPRRARFAYS
jgi:multisubunit Na+/H+ antiporter MnhG subunit